MNNNSNIALFNEKKAMYSIRLQLNKKVFYRYCVVPIEIEQQQIVFYLANSLHTTVRAIEFIYRNEDVFVISNLVDKRQEINNGFIDSYWIDTVEYVLEVQKQENIQTYHLVVGMDTEEQFLEETVRKYFYKEHISLETFRDAWMMRDESFISME